MKKTYTSVIIVLVILILGIGFLTASLYNAPDSSNNSNINTNKNEIRNNEIINQQNINEGDSCTIYNSNYPCFNYEEVEQERGNGNLDVIEQIKKQPCEKPKIVCKRCLQPLEQEKGEGYLDIIEQTRESC